MTTIKIFSLTLAIIFICTLSGITEAQTPRVTTVNVKAEADTVHISAEGDVSEMRLEVVSESGDIVFESGAITGNTLAWNMTDAQGERVSPGTYLVTVAFRSAAGKLRKRVEQITVAEDEKSGRKAAAAPEAVQATITGSGTAGKIARFSGPSTIVNSSITESANKIGIGTSSPTSRLTVAGIIEMTGTGPSTGIKFFDGSIQRKASFGDITGVKAGAGLAGGGISGDVTLSVVGPLNLSGSSSSPFISVNNVGIAAAIYGKGFPGIIGESMSGEGVVGKSAGFNIAAVRGTNTGGGTGVAGSNNSNSSAAVIGVNFGTYDAVRGEATNGVGVHGIGATGVKGESTSGNGVYGESDTGYAGFFSGNAKVTGNLEVGADATTIYPLTVSGNLGAGQNQGVAEFTNGVNDTGVRINNTASSGRVYTLFSSGGATSIGAGNFNIFDATANASRLSINSSGSVGIGTTAPKTTLDVAGGKIYVEAAGQGMILKSPNGTCYEVTVADGGALVTAAITCPM